MIFACKYDGKALVPYFTSGHDQSRKLKKGQLYECEIKQPRNYQFHKKFFALLNLAFDNQDFTGDFEIFRKAILIEAGYSETLVNKNTGEVHVFAKSLSFGKMSEDEFQKVYDDVHKYICKTFRMPDNMVEELINFM